MLFDNKKHMKAKQYKCVTISKEKHLIVAEGTETEIIQINPDRLVKDYIELISEYAKCNHLRLDNATPRSYAGISDKKEQNKIANFNAHFFKEQSLMIDALMKFINKYGLLGIMNDGIKNHNKYRLNSDGSYSWMQHPETVFTYDDDDLDDDLAVRPPVPYIQYIKPFYPDVSDTDIINLKGADRIIHYAEYFEDILQNKRIIACTEYISQIDKQNTHTLNIQGMNAVLSIVNEEPLYDIKCRSLIEFCHSMLFINEISGKNKKWRICHYKRCHKPFNDRNGNYCCEACMRNANKAKKRGDQDNG